VRNVLLKKIAVSRGEEMKMETARNVIKECVKEGGKILLEYFNRPFQVWEKSKGNLVTEVDLKSEEKIKSIIQKNFPEHGILGEESGFQNTDSEYLWVIDPLDGTTNYSMKNPFFNVSVSLAKNNNIVLACTYVPVTNELFFAEKGEGAFLNEKPIRVSKEADISKLNIAFCNGGLKEDKIEIAKIFAKLKLIARDFDRLKSGALELAFVASGRLGGYLANNNKAWDSAAGSLLVKEAGGKVTDFEGNPWNVESKDILATNKKIHQEILDIVKEIREQDFN